MCRGIHKLSISLLLGMIVCGVVLAIGGLAVPAGAAGVPACPQGITSYWKFDETAGATFADSVGGNSAACSEGIDCPGFTAGIIGNGLVFDGSTTALTVVASPSFDWGSAASFSIEVWIKIDGAGTCSGGQSIVGRNDNNTQLRWWVGCQEGGQATFFLYSKDGAGIGIAGTTLLNDGNWHHIVAVRDGVAAENRIFVDGVLENTLSILYTDGFDSSTAGLNIGWLNLDSGHSHLAGIADEVALYNVMLSATEIEQHYENGSAGIGCCDTVEPMITSTSITTAVAGEAYTYTVTATGTPAPTFSLTASPSGMTIDGTTGLIQWTPSAAGSFDVTVEAGNGVGTPATQSFTIQVSPAPAAPAITSAAVTTAVAGQVYSYTVTATGTPAPTFSLTTSPSGMTIGGTTGLIQWTPSAAGSFDVTVEAGNGVGTPATQSFTIQVNPAPAAPAITSVAVTTAVAGQVYSYTVTATGTPAPTFSLTTSPSGMTIDGTTGLIQWTPSAAGSFDVTVEAGNGVGTPATQSFTIQVSPAPAAPAITSVAVTTAVAGQVYSYSVTATGTPAPTFSLTTSPSGMTINAAGLIQWTPSSVGSYEVAVKATNASGNTTQSFTIVVDGIVSCSPNITNYWMFDEASGTMFADSVGGNNAGCAAAGCPASTPDGRINRALVFDGINSGLSVPAAGAFSWGNADNFSIEYWIKLDAANTCSGNQVVVGRDDPVTNLQWWVGCSNGKAAFYLFDTLAIGGGVTGTSNLADGKWHHIAALRDAAAEEIRLYVDGTKEAQLPLTYQAGFDSSAQIDIGWLNLLPGYHFAGAIDEVAFYNREISDSEIRQHFFDGSVGLKLGHCGCASTVRIMPLGDSITEGTYGIDELRTESYITGFRQPLFLSLQNTGYRVDFVGSLLTGESATPAFDADNEGQGGFTSSQIAANVVGYLTANPADIVLLHIGTNGFTTSPAGVESILDAIDSYSEDTTVILARIINHKTVRQDITTFNDNVQAMAEQRIVNGDKIIIVDQEGALTYPDDMADSLHPNDSGYSKMADTWMASLRNVLPVCGEFAPSIISEPVTSVIVGKRYVYNVAGSGNPIPTYSLTQAPSGMTINAGTGHIEWNPSSTGTFSVTVQASNGVGTPASQSFTLEVVDAPPCPSSMTNYWKLEETEGVVYKDFYGTSNALCTSCPSPAAGIIGSAQWFNTLSNVSVSDNDTFDWALTSGFSIELWMKMESGTCTGNKVFLGRNDTSTHMQWWVGCQQGNQAAFYVLDKNGNDQYVSGTRTLTDGNWHHIVAVRDAVAAEIRIYVDGVRESSMPVTYASGFESSKSLNIGWLNSGGGYHFTGIMDEIALYNSALSDFEVSQHYVFGTSVKGYCDEVSPSIISEPVTTAAKGVPYTYDVEAMGNPALEYTLMTKPAGMTINPDSGLIQWTPASTGNFDVTVRVRNGVTPAAVQSFVVTVSAYVAPSITSTPVTETYVGLPYAYDVDATGNPVPGYELVTGPSGMTINDVTGIIQWIPTAAGDYSVTVRAANGGGTPSTQDFIIYVGEMPPYPAGMTHYWKLDETEGQPYIDSYGSNDATCSNCPIATAGTTNGAQQFDSFSQVVAGDDNTFDWGATESFSVEFWMKTDPASTCSGNQVVVGRDDSSTNLHWWAGCLNGGAPVFVLVDKNGNAATLSGSTDLTDGAWHHIVAVRDAGTNEVRLYVDTMLEASVTKTYAGGFGSAAAALNIGWLNLGAGYHFVGTVDEVALYNMPLSDAEILQHYTSGLSGQGYGYGLSVKRIGLTTEFYTGLQDAYVAASDGDIIQGQAIIFNGDLDFALDIPVVLIGGYNSVFSSSNGYSTVKGSLTIGKGTVIIDRIVIQ